MDDSDDEQPRRVIENQPYDETLDVPDADEVASIYTPTPRHPKNQQQVQQRNQAIIQQHQQQQNSRTTPPPTSSSLSSGSNHKLSANIDPGLYSIKEDEAPTRQQRPQPRGRDNKMSSDQSDNTPKQSRMQERMDSDGDDSDDTESQDQHQQQPHRRQRDPDDYDDDPHGLGSSGGAGDGVAGGGGGGGGYDPSAYRDLPVSAEIKDIFKLIERYQPQNIELEFKLKPFIPDYIPSIGDIDAFIKVPRPDNKPDNLGMTVVDEPSSNQSDPHVLDLFFRTLSKQNVDVSAQQSTTVKSVDSSNNKAIDQWIKSISALQKNKPIQTVNYQRAMPSIESLMQIWPQEYEDLLKELSLPSSELNVDLNTYTDIICALLDIPVYKSRIQSIHVLFSLFSEFKNSPNFRGATNNAMGSYARGNSMMGNSGIAGGAGKRDRGDADRLVID